MRPLAGNDKIQEVFWIVPDVASKQSTPELVWYKSEFMYTRMNTDQKDPLPALQLEYCKDGWVMLAPSTQQLQGGCGANSVPLTMGRVN
jgi:hypothetical protein